MNFGVWGDFITKAYNFYKASLVYFEENAVKPPSVGKIGCFFKEIGILVCGIEPKIGILKDEVPNPNGQRAY